jgi:hypothetical protein
MFGKHCSGNDLKNTHSVIVHRVSSKTVNAGFSFHSCLLTVHAFTRIKETRIKIKLCGIFWMDWSTSCIHLWSFQNNPWVVSSSIPTTKQSPRSSILTQTFKSEMHPRCFIALCIQVNQHKTKIVKSKLELGVRHKTDKASTE